MPPTIPASSPAVLLVATCAVAFAAACSSDRGEFVRVAQERDALRTERDRLVRDVEGQQARLFKLQQQNDTLVRFGSNRPVDLFAPVKIELVERSGGADYDGKPGDDGITVYLRPVDADGTAVKAPGEIRIELTDATTPGRQTPLGLYAITDPNEIRKLWYGRFGTNHYTIKCPFAQGKVPPSGARVLINVQFLDFLSGRSLTTVGEVTLGSRS